MKGEYSPIAYAVKQAFEIALPTLLEFDCSKREIFAHGIYLGALAAQEAARIGLGENAIREVAAFEASPGPIVEALTNG